MAYARDLKNKVAIEFGPGAMNVRRAILFDPRNDKTKRVSKDSLLRDRFEWLPPDIEDWVLFLATQD